MSKETFLKDLTFEELTEYYCNALTWIKRIEEAPSENVAFAMKGMSREEAINTLLIDASRIYIAMVQKIPDSHIQQIKNLMAIEETTDIAPGQRYEHKHTPGMIIEIHRPNERLWVCGQYLHNKYIMICNLSMQVIMTNYKRLNP